MAYSGTRFRRRTFRRAFTIISCGVLPWLGVATMPAADADLDTSYHTDGWSVADMAPGSDTAYGVAIQADGRVVVVGSSSNGSDLDFAATRRAVNGNVDMTLGGDGKVFVNFGFGDDEARDVVIEPGGNIIVVGTADYLGQSVFGVVRLSLLDGTVLGAQTVPFAHDATANAVALQPDGRIVVVGAASNGSYDNLAVARLNSNLGLDSSFGVGGRYTHDPGADAILWDAAIEADGRILAVGSFYNVDRYMFLVQRLSSAGAPAGGASFSFADDAAAHRVALQPDGKIVVVGSCETNFGDMVVMRLNQNLIPDASFSDDGRDVRHFSFGRDEAWDVAVQVDGRIVVGGWLSRDGSLQELALLRYTADGDLDSSFNSYGYVSASYGGWDTFGRAMDVQPDGKIVVAGYSTGTSTNLFVSARFLGDESLIFADDFEWGSTELWSVSSP